MEKTKLPFFGKVSIDKSLVEQDYQTYVRIDNWLVEFNLIFETENLEISDLQSLTPFLHKFNEHLNYIRLAILHEYNSNDDIKRFIKTNIEALTQLGKEVLQDTLAKDMTLENYFLQELELARVYFFPDDDNEFVKLIFQISEDFTDEILFVRLGTDFKIKEISTEY